MREDKYLNFPIQLISNAHSDIQGTCLNIFYYAAYAKYQTLEFGSDADKMQSVSKYMGIDFGNWQEVLNNGRAIFDSLPENLPMTGAKISMIFAFRDNFQTDFHIAAFCAFCALKSIIGNKPYINTDNKFLVARMGGFASKKDVPDELPLELDRFTKNDYQIRKLKTELENNWGLTHYSRYMNGFYVSFKLSKVDLITQAEKRRKIFIEKKKSDVDKEAYNQAMRKIWS